MSTATKDGAQDSETGRRDYIPPDEGRSLAVPAEVLEAEAAAIARRRRNAGLEEQGGLAGLCFSGGGIRSATFNLGILEALDGAGLLRFVDYLSTVSGGGYIGGCLSSSFAEAKAKPGEEAAEGTEDLCYAAAATMDESICRDHTYPFPFRHEPGVTENRSFVHLRNYSKYLTPRRALAKARLVGLMLRGPVANFLVILPILLVLAGLSVLVWGRQVGTALQAGSLEVTVPASSTCKRSIKDCVGVLDVPLGIGPDLADYSDGHPISVAIRNVPKRVWLTNDGAYLSTMPSCSVVEDGVAFRDVLPTDLDGLRLEVPSGFDRDFVLSITMWRETLAGGDAAIPCAEYWKPGADRSTFGDLVSLNPVSRFLDRRFGATKVAALAFLAILVLYPVGQALQRVFQRASTWEARDLATRYILGLGVVVIGLFALVALQPVAIYYFHRFAGDPRLETVFGDFGESVTSVLSIASVLLTAGAKVLTQDKSGKVKNWVALVLFGALGPLVIWLIYLNLCRWAVVPVSAPGFLRSLPMFPAVVSEVRDAFTVSADAVRLALIYLSAAVLLSSYWLVFDSNRISFHRFYRDRLSRAYLFDPWRKDDPSLPPANDGQKLSTLDTGYAPYHLINGTLNLQASQRGNTRGRDGMPFLFSRDWVGSPLTGYCRTAKMETLDQGLDLGTAVAISGAAAAPNMGAYTIPVLTFLLVLLNIRLGYWLPHPRNGARGWLGRALLSGRAGPQYLFREMVGWINEKAGRVNVTDGGHFENLGLYELIRRKCRFIVACDAEADPAFHFGGLAQAVRLARIDFGVRIDIDVDAIRPGDETGVSGAHCALGTIDYGGDAGQGLLLYIKSSVTGDEDIHIAEYRAEHPDFPNETTADQFFDEAQFEAYRALGKHVGDSVLADRAVADFVAELRASIPDRGRLA